MTFLRVARLLFALPGRLMISIIDRLKARDGVGPLNGFQRGAVHGFVWICALIAFSMAVTPATTATAVPAAKVTTARPSRAPTPITVSTAPVAEVVTVARVVDGDTFELADGRKVRVLGIDSCESDTPGGKWATQTARDALANQFNWPITMTREPGVDLDPHGRLLRYVQLNGNDFGESMVGWDHTGVYQGHNDASAAYIARLYAHDRDTTTLLAPAGRDCGLGDYWGLGDYGGRVTGGGSVSLPDNDDDHHKSRFCRRHWFC